MKVLFVGHYREGSGWAQAAIDWILALDAAGVDVVCRPIKLNNENPPIPERVKELESKSSIGCDYVIQNVLPHFMDYDGEMKKNVGMFFSETLNLKYTGWPSRLNTMDVLGVPCSEALTCCNNSGIDTVRTYVIPCATDITKFSKEYEKYQLPDIINSTYKFYFIGENIRRKHLTAALVAFYTQFTKYDNVSFVIKTHRSGQHFNDTMNQVEAEIRAVKDKLRMYKDHSDYPIHCIITGHLSEQQIYSIHQQCDCFVMPSFGEGWCIPAFDAMGFGKTVVANSTGGMIDFLHAYSNGFLVDSSEQPIVGYDVVFDDMNTGRDYWKAVSINSLSKTMRLMYDEREAMSKKTNADKIVSKYSYEKVGETIRKVLENG